MIFSRKLARNICANFPCQCLSFIPLFWIKKLLVCKYKSKFKQSKFSSHTKHHSYGESCVNDMIKWIFFFILIQKNVYLYLLLPQCTLFLSVSIFGGKLLTVHPWVCLPSFVCHFRSYGIFRSQKPLKSAQNGQKNSKNTRLG